MARIALILLGAVLAYFLTRLLTMRLKHGVSLENMSWRMFYAAVVMDGIFSSRGTELVITSGADGKHSAQSKHYAENNPSGMVEAIDVRTHQVRSSVHSVAQEIRSALGSDYDVVVESDHIHVEYDPKTPQVNTIIGVRG